MNKDEQKIPKYDIIVHGQDMCINFVCMYLGVAVSALINKFIADDEGKFKLDLSFPKEVIDTYSEDQIESFQEQILECCYDTLLKQKEVLDTSETINED